MSKKSWGCYCAHHNCWGRCRAPTKICSCSHAFPKAQRRPGAGQMAGLIPRLPCSGPVGTGHKMLKTRAQHPEGTESFLRAVPIGGKHRYSKGPVCPVRSHRQSCETTGTFYPTLKSSMVSTWLISTPNDPKVGSKPSSQEHLQSQRARSERAGGGQEEVETKELGDEADGATLGLGLTVPSYCHPHNSHMAAGVTDTIRNVVLLYEHNPAPN